MTIKRSGEILRPNTIPARIRGCVAPHALWSRGYPASCPPGARPDLRKAAEEGRLAPRKARVSARLRRAEHGAQIKRIMLPLGRRTVTGELRGTAVERGLID